MNEIQEVKSLLPLRLKHINTDAPLHRITVCTRPFRASGPRIEIEQLGEQLLIHNYGHGGSGWSLSWGSAACVLDFLRDVRPRSLHVAVIGAGAIGITTALTLQRAGYRVSIYAQDRPLETRSARATGSWTPDSRIALREAVSARFEDKWRWLARETFSAFEPYISMTSRPVEWADRFVLSDSQPDPQRAEFDRQDSHGFFRYSPGLDGITASMSLIPREQSPFPTPYAWRSRSLTFNVSALISVLLEEFQHGGGRIEVRTFRTPADLTSLRERVIANCTGWGARHLFGDKSLTPIRGQIAWLPAQPGVSYGVVYGDLRIVGRQDGIVVQHSPQGDDTGWNDASETPDPEAASAGVKALASLQAGIRRASRAVPANIQRD